MEAVADKGVPRNSSTMLCETDVSYSTIFLKKRISVTYFVRILTDIIIFIDFFTLLTISVMFFVSFTIFKILFML